MPPRSAQVLELFQLGLTERKAADRLDIGPHTVHLHAKLLYAHFGVSTRAALLAAAL